MSRDVVSVTELASLGEIADLMETKRIKRVPVLHDGKLVGIVSGADLLRVLASGGANSSTDDRDGLIRSRLLADLRKQKWANCSESDIVVSDGIVHFWGVVGSEEERRALRVAAEISPACAASRTIRSRGRCVRDPCFQRSDTNARVLLGSARPI
jgi:CBS domain-containing protein